MGLWDILTWGVGRRGGETVEVKTSKGIIAGYKRDDTGIHCFRGVPFAAPPVGPLRFKKPQPHPAWDGVLSCCDFGKVSVQSMSLLPLLFMRKILAGIIYGMLWITGNDPISNYDPKKPQSLPRDASEDCLTLNIESPYPILSSSSASSSSSSPPPLLPVMVWIHGGAFQFGTGSQMIYHPHDSPLSRQGIVLVTINYRLGLLGFLKVDGGDYNNGIWDQISALQWVQENIPNFGGDPTNVTIFGESAGGMSVATLTATKYAGSLFQRAILQSGSGQTAISKSDASWLTEECARVLELPTCSMDSLKDVSAATLLTVQNAVIRNKRCGQMPFQPTVDNDLLSDRIVSCWKDGVAKDVEFMIGYTRDEEIFFLKIFAIAYTCQNEEELYKRILRLFAPDAMGVANAEEAAKKALEEVKCWEGGPYPTDPSHQDYWTLKAVLFSTILKFAIPAHVAAEALIGKCKKIYMFRFDVHSPLMGGACHAIDLPYVFGSYRVFGRLCPADAEGNATLAQAVVKAWANFAKNGDPNTTTTTSSSEPPHLPTWPPLTSSDLSKLMIIDLPLSNSRVQSVKLHEAFPEMWKIALEDARALWFHRPAKTGLEEKGLGSAIGMKANL